MRSAGGNGVWGDAGGEEVHHAAVDTVPDEVLQRREDTVHDGLVVCVLRSEYAEEVPEGAGGVD